MRCECGRKVRTIKNGKTICGKCNKKNRKIPQIVCSKCGKSDCSYYKENGESICRNCYMKDYKTPIKRCSRCDKFSNIFNREPILCKKCYTKTYNAPKKICVACGEENFVHKNTECGPICSKCYSKSYKQKKKKCLCCGKLRKLATKKLCVSCRNKERCKEDYKFAIRTKLRKRVSKNVRNGKMRKSLSSLIDYSKIIEYLGEPPSKEYHIDHIFPLSAFDLTKESHIRAAFAPENHQWLLDKENLSKKDKYDEDLFKEYISRFLIY